MTTLTIQVSGSAIVNGSKSWTFTDADLQTIIDIWTTKGLGVSTALTPATPRTPTQALVAWATSFVTTTVADVRSKRESDAKSSVVDAVFS